MKGALHEDFCKNWEDNIKIMPKLRSYIKFKKVFEVEPYVLNELTSEHLPTKVVKLNLNDWPCVTDEFRDTISMRQ